MGRQERAEAMMRHVPLGGTTVQTPRDGCFVRSCLPLVAGKRAGYLLHRIQEDARSRSIVYSR
jgi:hypothetical protein